MDVSSRLMSRMARITAPTFNLVVDITFHSASLLCSLVSTSRMILRNLSVLSEQATHG